MAEVDMLDMQGQKVGKVDLPDAIFNVEPNRDLLFRYIHKQLADKRQGSASAKTKAEVSGGGRKPWAQKHTGRARAGSNRSPLWRHGGVTFPPKPRDYSERLNKKMKVGAIKSALSVKFRENKLIVVNELKMDKPKTKDFIDLSKKIVPELNALYVLDTMKEEQMNVKRSSGNVPHVKVIVADNPGKEKTNVDGLNVYDIMKHEWLVLTKATVDKLVEVYENGK
ncbi:50S ribosomal protein L4 [Mesoaciditoga lauensis]|uniref:50S ribosomal protein L4 n=1 Tax=Mesoaciditoga lauensis TaxID=1495039 RepID=UPI00055A347C|nr:50S ribosomal protein L4 [Mesoaciditoga lauensis]